MKRTIFLCMFLYMLHPAYSQSHYCFEGCANPIPGRPYKYEILHADGIALSSRATTCRIEITNGKIMDNNGNFTLTSKTGKWYNDLEFSTIKWNGSYNNSTKGTIWFYEFNRPEVGMEVTIQPSHLLLSSQNWTNNEKIKYESPYITTKDIYINQPDTVQINGFLSVILTPGFTAIKGSNIRIHNGTPTDPKKEFDQMQILPSANYSAILKSISEDGSHIQYKIPQETQSSFLYITDIYGNYIEKIPIQIKGENEISIDNSGNPTGTYVYTLIVNNQVVDSRRVLKK